MESTTLNIMSYFPVASAAVSLLVLFFGVYQYRMARLLDRAKFAADLTEKIYKDEYLIAAWNFIDCVEGHVRLPEKYQYKKSENPLFMHRAELMSQAFSMKSRGDYDGVIALKTSCRTRQAVIYVEILDRALSFIEGVYGYYMTGAIDASHITHILFFIDRLSRSAYKEHLIFRDYLLVFRYWRVLYMAKIANLYLERPVLAGILPRFAIQMIAWNAVRKQGREEQAARSKIQKDTLEDST